VAKSCFYEPDLNPTYQDMASHYGCAVIPIRVRAPVRSRSFRVRRRARGLRSAQHRSTHEAHGRSVAPVAVRRPAKKRCPSIFVLFFLSCCYRIFPLQPLATGGPYSVTLASSVAARLRPCRMDPSLAECPETTAMGRSTSARGLYSLGIIPASAPSTSAR